MTVEVRNDEAQKQYTILEDDRPVGFAVYEITGNEIAFTHTEVDPKEQGKGYAAILVQYALDDVRATSQRRVIPACSYVEHFVEKHAEYEELTRR
ncbi:N-acetyltransferase [Frondihabitans sucicola]|uniref:N-acetyltransferase n=1 Tax=Frondihabitans sucicola TaxID=1268041 RepID=A0ABM8GI27_9MICO|nr:GNAT family N-acetyltransferase [Frondihabitans sucicola]BDZ48026.1 N-acetyltransferase [Frondihabitans sucicola]